MAGELTFFDLFLKLLETPPDLLSNISVLLAKFWNELRVVRVTRHSEHVMVHQHLSNGGSGGGSLL